MSIKRQATSNKLLSNKRSKIHEAWALANGYKQQASSDKLRQIVARQNVALTDKPES